MAQRGRHRKGGRVTPRGTRPGDGSPNPHSRPQSHGEPGMLTMIRRSLNEGDPLGFLLLASSLLAALDPRRHPLERTPGARTAQRSASEFCDTFIHTNLPEASAMLAAFAQMGDDELLRARARRELTRRSH